VTAALATLVWIAAGAGPGVVGAQTPPAKSPLWDGLYTDEQASRGNAVFGTTCSNCHTLDSQGNRPLSGKKFWDSYTQKTVGDLFTFVQKNMPNGNGGSLSEKTYADLVALILKSNGVPAGTTELVPSAVAAPDDATRPLGEKSIALKFLLTKLDADIGKRVSATGLLIGADGINGLNVSTVTKVADSCP
jgi:mono/diheme cytochrome c family protein